MKNKYIMILFLLVCNTAAFADTNVNREGFSFAAGLTLTGGCVEKSEIDNDKVSTKDKFCIPIPLLDLSVGYNFTPQFTMNLETQTLVVGGLVGLEAQYYLNDAYALDSMYVYAGAMKGYTIDDGISSKTAGSIGVGYAKENMEYEAGIMGTNKSLLLLLSAKYMF